MGGAPINDGGEDPSLAPENKTRQVLWMFVLLKVLVSYDSGAFSAVLGADNGITDDLELSTSQQGALGSTVFLGNTVGCAIAGHLFMNYSAKMLLTGSLIAHTLLTLMFGMSNYYEFDMIIRFLLGVTLAFIVVYSPIWVDEFAPKQSATLWMALCNAGVPVGIMIGFVVGGMLPSNTALSWRWAFFLKVILMVPLTMYFHSIDRTLLDSKHAGGRDGTVVMSFEERWSKLWAAVKQLLTNGLMMSNIMALCSLYFVVTALQTFVTPYLRGPPFFANMNTIVIGFGGAVVTAPVLGVVVGGLMLDRIGGYHNNLFKASLFELGWGIAAGIVGFICMSAKETTTFLIIVWVLLFCGGAIVPAATGIIMASIEEHKRAAASSFSAICFNLFGYFMGPLVCGIVADEHGLEWGIRTAFIVSFLGVIPMSLAVKFAKTHRKSAPEQVPDAKKIASDVVDSTDPGHVVIHYDDEIAGELSHAHTGKEAAEGVPHVTSIMEMLEAEKAKEAAALAAAATPRSPGLPPIHTRSPAIRPISPSIHSVDDDLDMDRVSNTSMHSFPNQFAVGLGIFSRLHNSHSNSGTPQTTTPQRSFAAAMSSLPNTPGRLHPDAPQFSTRSHLSERSAGRVSVSEDASARSRDSHQDVQHEVTSAGSGSLKK